MAVFILHRMLLPLAFLPELPTSAAPVLAMVLSLRPLLIPDGRGIRGVGSEVTGQRTPAQKTLHLKDEFGLVFQLDLQLSDLSLKLKRVFRNAVLIKGLQAFQTDLKKQTREGY